VSTGAGNTHRTVGPKTHKKVYMGLGHFVTGVFPVREAMLFSKHKRGTH